MDLSRYTRGEEITTGVVYRRIPYHENHFDYELGRPTFHTFAPRPDRDDGALSAQLDPNEAREIIAKYYPRFGLYSLDIATMNARTNGKARVVFWPTSTTPSHVRIWGCKDDIDVQLILAAIAERVFDPRR